MNGDLILTNCQIFTGSEMRTGHAVVVEDGIVTGLPPSHGLPRRGAGVVDLGGRTVSPGFIDLQVNGGGDLLFNDEPTVETLRGIVAAHRRFGTTDLLPTFITGPPDRMALAAEAVRRAIEQGVDGVLGIHFEGPLVNRTRLGAHDARNAQTTPDAATLTALTTPTGGITLVTLAPEVVPGGLVAELVRRGVCVAAGHTEATAAEVTCAVAEGVTGATHVWNAMRPPTAREPGAVGALLADPRVRCSFIADGHHVAWPTLRVSLRALHANRAILVSDAVGPLGGTATSFELNGRRVSVADGRCTTDDGVLAGSVTDLATAVRNVIRHAGVPKADALRMVTRTPADLLGQGHRLGRIGLRRPARFTVFDDDVNVSAVVTDGELTEVPS